jgi:CRISPR-associated endonuclease Cas2
MGKKVTISLMTEEYSTGWLINMKVIICFDICKDNLRRKLVKHLEKFAIRVQYSVFKADMTDLQIKNFNEYVNKLISNKKDGNVLIYRTSENYSDFSVDELPKEYIIF